MDDVRQKSGIIAAKVRKSRHKRLGKTVFLKAKKETTCKHFHQSSLFALCLYSVACDVPPGKLCSYVPMSFKDELATHVFYVFMSKKQHKNAMFLCLYVKKTT